MSEELPTEEKQSVIALLKTIEGKLDTLKKAIAELKKILTSEEW